jgi:rhamnosyltransferase
MTSQDVLAVVVSYNGSSKIRRTVDALRPQVGHVHIVDNGSEEESAAVLDALERVSGVSVERLGENRGIGHALNRGVLRAREMGFAWLLTMDQDSLVDPTFVSAFQAAVEQDSACVCLAPTTAYNGRIPDQPFGEVGYAITSGNLVRLSVFDSVGLYDEGLFIDCVDFDFSLRVRRAGYAVHRVPAAVMHHQLGEAVDVPRFVSKYYASHSPVRRYYMYRNYLYLAERYFFRFPLFILKLGALQLLLCVLIPFFDRRPGESFRAIARGVADYLARRRGAYRNRR